jgi:hypothetical protein
MNIFGKGNVVVSSGSIPYVSSNVSNPMQGMVRINGTSMEVFDNNHWITMASSAEIGLSSEAEHILEWAREKMLEERRIDELCKQHPGLAKARDNYELFKRLADTEFKE